jgi:alanyl-tRNA synthetase
LRSTQEAIAEGAMALFGEKYGDTVRVVTVPGFSVELCGGTHVRATGDIGSFVITAESSVAAGVRRIEALTGSGAVQWLQDRRSALQRIVSALHVGEDQAVDAIERAQTEAKRLAREVSQLKLKLAAGGGGASVSEQPETVEVAGVRLARRRVADLDRDSLRGLADALKTAMKSGVVVVASSSGAAAGAVRISPRLAAGTPNESTRCWPRPNGSSPGCSAPDRPQVLSFSCR